VLKDAVSIYRTTRENAPALGRMPAFARLTAGANEIRNLGLTLNGMAAESAPAAIVLWPGPAGRSGISLRQHSADYFERAGTEGSKSAFLSESRGAPR
jgi:hypothetical protein